MISSHPLAIKCVGREGVLESLIKCTEMAESINLGVNNYLEKKRLFFPRLNYNHSNLKYYVLRLCN